MSARVCDRLAALCRRVDRLVAWKVEQEARAHAADVRRRRESRRRWRARRQRLAALVRGWRA